MSRCRVLLALIGLAVLGGAAAQAASTAFVALPPCRIADTRLAGGPYTGNKAFKILGPTTDFSSQGGVAAGCGMPGFAGSTPQVQAIALNLVAVNATGSGYLTAFAGDTPRPPSSTLNYAGTSAIANGVIVGVRQIAPAGVDIKVFASTTTDVFMDVTGYFTDITLVDGAGSGIDADTVDGLHASDLGDVTGVTAGTGLTGGATSGNATLNLDLTASNTWTGNTTFNPGSGLAFSTGTGDDIELGGSIRKGGALFLHTNPPLGTGVNNVGLGVSALSANTLGHHNTALGASALKVNTGGNYNVATGAYALFSNTTGDLNTANGAGALAFNTAGYNNTASGTSTLYHNTTGHHNTASGAFALKANTTGYNNTAAGVSVLAANTTGFGNTASGAFALVVNTTGYRNTAAGDGALVSNTSGHDNTASGSRSLEYNTTGFRNTATGAAALSRNTTGLFNTASGSFALANNETGGKNTADGISALSDNTTGDLNTAVGYKALALNSGSQNTAIGANALLTSTSGTHNVAVGYGAGRNIVGGSYNIDIGNNGNLADSGTIRIGTDSAHTSVFMAGIAGVTVSNAAGVLIDTTTGQLGTIVSSRRYKEEIRDMGSVSERLLKLRPVSFRYKREVAKGERPIEFGLIAEEVAEVFPELVVYGRDGQPETVKYHVLASLLLNELQKQKARVEERERELEARLAEERRAREEMAVDIAEESRAREKLEAQLVEDGIAREKLDTQLADQREEFARRLAALLDRMAAIEGRGGSEEAKPVLIAAPSSGARRR